MINRSVAAAKASRFAWLSAMALAAQLFASAGAQAAISQDRWGAIVLTGNQFQLWRQGQLRGRAACVSKGKEMVGSHLVEQCVCAGAQAMQQTRTYARVNPSPRRACPGTQSPGSAACGSPRGTWRWFDGQSVTLHANHAATSSLGGRGVWAQGGSSVTLRWPNFRTEDHLVLRGGGLELFGTYGIKSGSPGKRASSTRSSCP